MEETCLCELKQGRFEEIFVKTQTWTEISGIQNIVTIFRRV